MLITERKANQESTPEEQKTYVKPQIETISGETQTITKEATQDEGHTDNYFTVYNGKHLFRVEKISKKVFIQHQGG